MEYIVISRNHCQLRRKDKQRSTKHYTVLAT